MLFDLGIFHALLNVELDFLNFREGDVVQENFPKCAHSFLFCICVKHFCINIYKKAKCAQSPISLPHLYLGFLFPLFL